jgi:hypothetical protein
MPVRLMGKVKDVDRAVQTVCPPCARRRAADLGAYGAKACQLPMQRQGHCCGIRLTRSCRACRGTPRSKKGAAETVDSLLGGKATNFSIAIRGLSRRNLRRGTRENRRFSAENSGENHNLIAGVDPALNMPNVLPSGCHGAVPGGYPVGACQLRMRRQGHWCGMPPTNCCPDCQWCPWWQSRRRRCCRSR